MLDQSYYVKTDEIIEHYGLSLIHIFGSGINMQNAVNIGMFPDVPLEKFHYIGNSSLTGAYLMLLSTQAEKKTYELASNMTYMELSTVPTYMDELDVYKRQTLRNRKLHRYDR